MPRPQLQKYMLADVTDDEIRETVQLLRQFILAHLIRERMDLNLDADTPLVSSGLLDSLAVVEIVMFLEDRLGVRLEAPDVDLSQLDTLDAIARAALNRRGARS
jgi:acyl carrier protein